MQCDLHETADPQLTFGTSWSDIFLGTKGSRATILSGQCNQDPATIDIAIYGNVVLWFSINHH